jgi:hypothetical protein
MGTEWAKTEKRFSAKNPGICAFCAYGSAISDVFKSLSCLKYVSGGHGDANFGVLGARRIIFFKRGAKRSTRAVLIHVSTNFCDAINLCLFRSVDT